MTSEALDKYEMGNVGTRRGKYSAKQKICLIILWFLFAAAAAAFAFVMFAGDETDDAGETLAVEDDKENDNSDDYDEEEDDYDEFDEDDFDIDDDDYLE